MKSASVASGGNENLAPYHLVDDHRVGQDKPGRPGGFKKYFFFLMHILFATQIYFLLLTFAFLYCG